MGLTRLNLDVFISDPCMTQHGERGTGKARLLALISPMSDFASSRLVGKVARDYIRTSSCKLASFGEQRGQSALLADLEGVVKDEGFMLRMIAPPISLNTVRT